MLLLALFNGISFAESVYYETNEFQACDLFKSEGGAEMSKLGKVRVSKAEIVKALMHWDSCASQAHDGRRGLSKEAAVILDAVERGSIPGGLGVDLDEHGEALAFVRQALLGQSGGRADIVRSEIENRPSGLSALRDIARRASRRILGGRRV